MARQPLTYRAGVVTASNTRIQRRLSERVALLSVRVSRWWRELDGAAEDGREEFFFDGELAQQSGEYSGPGLVRVPTSHVPYGPKQQAVPVPARPGGGHRPRLEEQLLPGGRRSAQGPRGGRLSANGGGGVFVEQQRLDVEQGLPDEGDGSR